MIKYTDTHYPTDNFKWIILNEEKAKQLHIEVINLDDGSSILSIDWRYIPNGISPEEYIKYIQDKKIAINGALNPIQHKGKTKKHKGVS